MLRKDPNAGFQKAGSWLFSQYRFQAAGLEANKALRSGAYGRLRRRQLDTPVLLLVDESRRRSWWMFRDEYYCDDDSLSEVEVKALLLEREARLQRRIQRAISLMEQTAVPIVPGREVIPDAVKRLVWRRDGGRCVNCGGRYRLEFDHIIPVSLGGASSEPNLQLLCADCNRQKGGALT